VIGSVSEYTIKCFLNDRATYESNGSNVPLDQKDPFPFVVFDPFLFVALVFVVLDEFESVV